jgi:alpha-L-rhamnosidase
MKRFVDLLEQRMAPTGYIWEGWSYADWANPGRNNPPPEGRRLTATAFIYYEARLLAKIARVLGEDEDAEQYDELAETVGEAFNDTFFEPDDNVYREPAANPPHEYRQTPSLLALDMGLVPDGHRRAVLRNLIADIRERGTHLNTGAVGTKLLLPLLTDTGHGELAYDLATQTSYPSWGYWFDQLGANTMWEYWEEDARSRDHAFLGTVDDWLYQYLAGIKPDAPGYKRVRIKPFVPDDLDRAAAHTETVRGRVSSSWRKFGDDLRLRVKIPANTKAKVYVPTTSPGSVNESGGPADDASGVEFVRAKDGYAVFRVRSGSYRFDATL